MVGQFFNTGRSDALAKRMANPSTAGVSKPEEYNEYMNGYNSVQELFQGIHRLIRAPKIKDLTLILTESLISSLGEPASEKTELDDRIKGYLTELATYDSKLEEGIRSLYNAVQKSKRYRLLEGEKTKQLNKDNG